MEIQRTIKTLKLRHTWTISRGSADEKIYNYIELNHEGITAFGEAAHNIRYGESTEFVASFLDGAVKLITPKNIQNFFHLIEEIQAFADGQQSGKTALDSAILDWNAKKLGVPVYRLMGLDGSKTCATSYSIGIDTAEKMQEKIQQVEGQFHVLKIKLGSSNDEEIMRAVRDVTNTTVRVDANEGWTDKQVALEKINWLNTLNVEFIEQPMPAGNLDDVAWLREKSPLPLVADEDVKTAKDIPQLAQAYDGINIKLMKSGGILEAFKMMLLARQFGLKIMLGCMVESSIGISAAAQLIPLIDWADLDGNLLISNDPFIGAPVVDGMMHMPTGAGLGVELR